MVTTLYLIVLIFSVILSICIILRNKLINSIALAFTFLVFCNSLGRYVLSTSNGLEAALLGQKLIYIGACFCAPTAIAIISQLIPSKYTKQFLILLYSLATLIFCSVMTIGNSQLYYREIHFVKGNDFSYIDKIYGPMHRLYPIFLFSCTVVLLFYCYKAFTMRRTISIRIILTMSVLTVSTISCYILDTVLNTPFQVASVSYLIITIFTASLYERSNIYNLNTNMANCLIDSDSIGYIEFDNKYRYMGCNKCASTLFPDIEAKWSIDCPIPADDSLLYTEIITWLKREKKEEKKTVQIGDSFYDLKIHLIEKGKHRILGYMIELVDVSKEQQFYQTLNDLNKELEHKVSQKTHHISHIKDMLILGMAAMVESRDNSTGGHIKRTSMGMAVFCEQLKKHKVLLNKDQLFFDTLIKVAPMHDLGKIAINDAILRKNSKFTEEEYTEMKRHSLEGSKIINTILYGVESDMFVEMASNVAHYHHEKWNGEGYPEGLSGNNIPLEARIMALVDVFDALVSKRCYKDAFSLNTAFQIIEESSGTHFDPSLTKIFLECRENLVHLYKSVDTNG